MDQIPGTTSVRFYRKKWFLEVVTIVPPIVAAGAAVWINYSDPAKKSIAVILLLAMIWLILASILRVIHAYQQDSKEVQQKDYEGLRGAMHVLYANLTRHLQYDDGESGRLRVTLHRVLFGNADSEPSGLEQMLPYIGGKGGAAGRKFLINPGIIGYVARKGEVRVASRMEDDHTAFINELVSKWGYTESAAKQLTADRKTWMAVPILSKDKTVLVVVYLDSKERDAFDDLAIELVLNSCTGIASYISERYSLPVVSGASSKFSTKTQVEKVVEVSEKGAVLKEKHIVLTKDAERELTSTATRIDAEADVSKGLPAVDPVQISGKNKPRN